MTQKTLTYADLQITPADIYEQMGYHDTLPDQATQAETSAVVDEVRGWLRPQFCFLVSRDLPDFNMGKIILRQLRGSEAYTFFICTSGVEYEDYQQQLMKQGDMVRVFIADALVYFHKALELREDVYGKDSDNPEIAQTCTNIADILINQEKFASAKEMLDRAVRIYEVCEEKCGRKQIDTSKAYYNLAKWHYAQGDSAEAEKWFRKVFDIKKMYLSDNEIEQKELERMIENCRKPL